MNICTKFMGMDIKSPIIVGSCGLTADLKQLKLFEKAGAGAVILKSIYEEEITQEINANVKVFSANFNGYPEAYDYVQQNIKEAQIDRYLNFIKDAKKELSIPVIASVNCISASEWMSFIQKIDNAGADGIELNMSILPADVNQSEEDIDRLFEGVIQITKRVTKLPISLKISNYFTSLARFSQKVSWLGISNISIFNKFSSYDIDIDTLSIVPIVKYSGEVEFFNTLRWTAIISKNIRCGLTAGTGVYKEEDIIKLVLAGAGSVQIVSALYEKGADFITRANSKLEDWMKDKGYDSIEQFKGKMSVSSKSASAFHRIQFMKYYSEI